MAGHSAAQGLDSQPKAPPLPGSFGPTGRPGDPETCSQSPSFAGQSSGDHPSPSGLMPRVGALTQTPFSLVEGVESGGTAHPAPASATPQGPCQAPVSWAAQGRHQLTETSSPQWPPCPGPSATGGPLGGPKARPAGWPWLGGGGREATPTGHLPLRKGLGTLQGAGTHPDTLQSSSAGVGCSPPGGPQSPHRIVGYSRSPTRVVGAAFIPQRRQTLGRTGPWYHPET